MEDKIMKMFFEPERWRIALNKASAKGISSAYLRDFMSPEGRKALLAKIIGGEYHIKRPHTAKIPKDTPGEYRTVFVNEGNDRIFLSIVNDLLFEICADMVHPNCRSYQKGVGCAKIVTKISQDVERLSGDEGRIIGWKSDLSKYFDSVPIEYIDRVFDEVERRHGKSLIIDIVREYYHNNNYYDSETKEEASKYQSLKQGCAVASFLADVVLYDIDAQLTALGGTYVRYSDDTLFVGANYQQAMTLMVAELGNMGMCLNSEKVEDLNNKKWFKFLGFAIQGKNISLGENRIKTFAQNISARTVKKIRQGIKFDTALHSVQSWLYCGNGEHSWATGVLKTINVKHDIDVLNGYIMDCLRAVKVGKSVNAADLGGLGWQRENNNGCVVRGKGRKVKTLRLKTGEVIPEFHTLGCMRNALLMGRDLYDSIVRDM